MFTKSVQAIQSSVKAPLIIVMEGIEGTEYLTD